MIFEKVVKIFENVTPEVDTADITKESALIEDLGLNSLTMMLLAVSVEEEFGIKFEETGELNTVGDVCDFIAAKTGLE